MLDPEAIDLADLALALEDHSEEHTWWLDPNSGSIDPRFGAQLDESERAVAAERGLIPIEPLPSAVAYGDMEEFVARVRDPRARHFLERAIEGRGAFGASRTRCSSTRSYAAPGSPSTTPAASAARSSGSQSGGSWKTLRPRRLSRSGRSPPPRTSRACSIPRAWPAAWRESSGASIASGSSG
jgi:hypothetical protein